CTCGRASTTTASSTTRLAILRWRRSQSGSAPPLRLPACRCRRASGRRRPAVVSAGASRAPSLAGVLTLRLLVERQERHHPLRTLAVEDDFVRTTEDALHGLEVHARARDLRRLLVFVVDLEEACCLAGGFRYHLLAVGLGRLQDALGLA